MSDGLKQKAANGVIWSAIERFSVQGISFLLTLIIARLVLPSEFGLIAMLGIFIAIAQSFIDSGFSNALIQKKDRTDVDFSTVFYFNLAISVAAYLIFYFSAPYIADFYREPQLDILSKWIGLNFIISGLAIVQRAKLTINLNFKTQAKASLTSVVISGLVGIYLAYNGYGVWALVVQTLLKSAIETILLWIYTHWRPQFVFSISSFKTLFAFGSKLLVAGILHTIYLNLYSLVIGSYYSATKVGYYNRAYSLAQFPSFNITQVISRAIFPIQCEIQNDEDKLSASFNQYLRLSCFIIFPIMMGLAAMAEPLIEFILTDKWLPAAQPLAILCIAYMWYPVMFVNNQILNVKGRSDYYLKAEIIKKVVGISILFITMPYGLLALCWGLVGYNLLDMVIIIFFAKKVIKTGYRKQIMKILPVFIISAITGAICYLLPQWISDVAYIQLLIGLFCGIGSYITLCYAFKFNELKIILSLIFKV